MCRVDFIWDYTPVFKPPRGVDVCVPCSSPILYGVGVQNPLYFNPFTECSDACMCICLFVLQA